MYYVKKYTPLKYGNSFGFLKLPQQCDHLNIMETEAFILENFVLVSSNAPGRDETSE